MGECKLGAMVPGLYIVSTPIGNAGDITLRALDVLKAVDLIVCEDTRVTQKLLTLYSIKKPLLSYHEHNAERVRPNILQQLQSGKRIALVSDAGTPLISDPGYKLIKACIEAKLALIPIPGVSAPIAALTVAGLPTDKFIFTGFPPPKSKARQEFFTTFSSLPLTCIFFESARRIIASLQDMLVVLGDRQAVVAREITKKFEEVRRGQISSLLQHYQEHGLPKGELVVLVGQLEDAKPTLQNCDELIALVLEKKSVRDTVQLITQATGLPHREVYAQVLAIKDQKAT